MPCGLLGKLGQARFDALDIEAEEGKWWLKSYFEIPVDEQWRLRDIRRRYYDICVLKPRLDLEAHSNAKRQRSTDAATKAEESAKTKALAYMGLNDVGIVTTDAGLATIRAGFESRGKLLGTKGSFIEYLRSQLRARKHAYGQTKAKNALPAIGSGSTLEDATRIVDGLRPLFSKPLLLIGAPDPLPSRERSQAVAPTELAKKLLVEYDKRMRKAWVQPGQYMDKGVFRLPRRAVAEGRKRGPQATSCACAEGPNGTAACGGAGQGLRGQRGPMEGNRCEMVGRVQRGRGILLRRSGCRRGGAQGHRRNGRLRGLWARRSRDVNAQ